MSDTYYPLEPMQPGERLRVTPTAPPPDAYPTPIVQQQDPAAAAYQTNNLSAPPAQEAGPLSNVLNRLLGTNGQERYQTWPERVVRSGFTLPGDVVSGAQPVFDPETGHVAEPVIQRAQDTAGLAMTGGLAGTGERGMVVGSGPVRSAPVTEKPTIPGPIWHSPVENAVETSTTAAAPGKQWLATLQNARGVKPEELDWTGLRDFLETKGNEKVTRQELQDHLAQNKMQLKDVEKGEKTFDSLSPKELGEVRVEFARDTGRQPSDAQLRTYFEHHNVDLNLGIGTKYHDYQLPGGENYREHLLTLPNAETRIPWSRDDAQEFRLLSRHQDILDKDEKARYAELKSRADARNASPDPYVSSHWDEHNVIAHVRTNDRMMGDKKTLHIEEVQSDWHQAGRKSGYEGDKKASLQKVVEAERKMNIASQRNDPNYEATADAYHAESARHDREYPGATVPDAPFKTSWPELAMKRMVRRAAEEGYGRISWTPGEAQAARYDLSKQVDKIHYNPELKTVVAYKDGRSVLSETHVSPKDLPDMIGKEAADKLINNPTRKAGSTHEISGQDLKVGGEGMREFYDKMLPRVVEKIGKAHGVKVQLNAGKIGRTLEDELRNRGLSEKSFNELSLSQRNKILEKVDAGKPVHYFDLPQSLKDQALQKGMPLFSGGHMFVPATAMTNGKKDDQ